MAGAQFNPDDEPVFNPFDLPTICDGADNAERECCDPCEQLLFCLRRSPIAITLPGLDLSRWLPCVAFSCDKILQSSGIGGTLSGGVENDVFHGTYLALAASEALTNGDCGLRGETTLCNNSWPDDESGGGDLPLTHTAPLGRTIYAPGATAGEVKSLKLAVRTECVTNDEDVLCVKFSVVLVFEYERPASICLEGCESLDGTPTCDPAIVAEIEAAGGWNAGSCIEVGCCVVAESALIPIDGLTPADLSSVELTPVPPPDWELVDPMEPTGPWQLAEGSYQCGAELLGFIKAVPFQNFSGSCSPEVVALCGVASFSGHHETGNDGCEHPEEGDATVWTAKSQSPDCAALHVWVPPPITMNAGDATLSVLSASCKPAADCGTCIPDPEKPHVAVPVAVSFTAAPLVGCAKQFTAIFPDCITPVEIYWSFGKVGASVAHEIVNLDPDGVTERKETITMVIVDERGCIYCYTADVTCGCCEGGAGGDLSVEPLEDGCGVELCASVTSSADPDCEDLAFIEVQYLSGGCTNYDDDCPCLPLQPGEDGDPTACFPCSFTMVDGECREIESVWSELRWRVWDRVCGCPGPWTYIENNPCAELGLIGGAPSLLTDNNVGLGQCYDDFPTCICDCYEEDFTWTAAWPAWFCGERVSLRWEHDTSGEEEGTIVNPGDPIEDQIAEYEIFEPGVLRGLAGHIMKMWLVTDSFTCPVYCAPFPECGCYPPNADFIAEYCEECEDFAVGPLC